MKRLAYAIILFAAMIACEWAGIARSAEEISPIEDLMREHGILSRILLVYEKELKEFDSGREPEYGIIFKSANIIKDFIEDYHEKLEEDHVFPRFEKAGRLAVLVKTLKEQHEAGRVLTKKILDISGPQATDRASNLNVMASAMRSFDAMYRPHKAREDTVLFPALHEIISTKEFDEMGDKFEEKERALFGKEGFEKIIASVGELEKQAGIDDISLFTPKDFSENKKGL